MAQLKYKVLPVEEQNFCLTIEMSDGLTTRQYYFRTEHEARSFTRLFKHKGFEIKKLLFKKRKK